MEKNTAKAFGTISIVYSLICFITYPSSLFGNKPISSIGVFVCLVLFVSWAVLGLILIRKSKLVSSPKQKTLILGGIWLACVLLCALAYTLLGSIWNELAFKKDPNLDRITYKQFIAPRVSLVTRDDSLKNIMEVDETGYSTFRFSTWNRIELQDGQLFFQTPYTTTLIALETSIITEYTDSLLDVYFKDKAKEISDTEELAYKERLEKEKRDQEEKRATFKLSSANIDQVNSYLNGKWKLRIELGIINGSAESFCYYVRVQGNLITIKKRNCGHYKNEHNAPEELIYHGEYSLVRSNSSKWISNNWKGADTNVLYIKPGNSDEIVLYLEQDKSEYLDEETKEPVRFVGQYGRDWGHFSREN